MVRPPPDPLLSVRLTAACVPSDNHHNNKKSTLSGAFLAFYRGLAEILANLLGYWPMVLAVLRMIRI